MVNTHAQILSILRRLTFFDAFSDEEKRQISAEDAHFRVYQSGDLLIRQGCRDQHLFILLSGTVAVSESVGGMVLAVLHAGDILGEMAFLTETQRTANVIAKESVIALKLDRVMFEQLGPDIREKFKDRIIAKLVKRLDAANKEVARLGSIADGDDAEPFEMVRSGWGLPPAGGDAPVFITGRELIRHIIANTTSLPAMPEVMIKVQKMIQHPATTPAQLAKIIETDPAMVAGILKVANSAYYGFRGKVSTIQHASALFGTRRLAELITAMSAGGVLGKAMEGYGLAAGDMWRHSITVACAAGEIAAAVTSDALDSAYMAGLLHDMGKIILDPFVRQRKVLFEHYFAAHPDTSIQAAERDILGFDHAVIAAILCEKWNLPKSIAFGIRHHHQPTSAGNHQLSHIVHLADRLAASISARRTAPSAGGKLDLDASTRSLVPLDGETLRAIAEKAHKYAHSLSGRLTRT